MAALDRFSQLVENYSDIADFACVYIAEAHPAEKKHFGGNFDIPTHKAFEDRLQAANVFASEFDDLIEKKYPSLKEVEIDVLVDHMEDEANVKYAAIPERLFAIVNGYVEYAGDVGPYGYDIDQLEEWLKKRS